MGQIRDAKRTRAKIIEAARQEFAARGFAGARIEAIARRAKLNKQLLYHYFPSKEALFDEILEPSIQERVASVSTAGTPGAIFRQRFRTAVEDRLWVRFLTWEAAVYPELRRITAQVLRQEAIARQAEMIAEQQSRGEISSTLKTELVQLAVYALATYPVAFPQITEMVTGLPPEDPGFQAQWSAFLDDLGSRLAQDN